MHKQSGFPSTRKRLTSLVLRLMFFPRSWDTLERVSTCSVLVLTNAATLAFAVVTVNGDESLLKTGLAVEKKVIYDWNDERLQLPQITTQTIPSYTAEALTARVQGTVIVNCVLRVTGRFTDCRLLRGIGYGLDQAAITEIQENWRARPSTLNGDPVYVRADIEVDFVLQGARPDEIPPQEAEGLFVERLLLVGLTPAQEARARNSLWLREHERFDKHVFDWDLERLEADFEHVSWRILGGNAGGVMVRFSFQR